jgi:DNA-binding transcriptional LysR family regulator
LADLDWGDLKIILALSRGGSVAAASRIMGVDSSTVSRRLSAAEASLDAVLVLRGGREFRFTPEGNMALRTAETIETSILSTTAAIKSAKLAIAGKVKITTVGSFYHVLSPICSILNKQYPDLHIEIHDADHIVSLANGDADIAFRMAAPTEPDVVSRKACEMGWFIYASKDYVAQYGLPKSPAELSEHRLILYTENRLHLPAFRWLEQFNLDAETSVRISNPAIAMRSALAGAGIVALPAYDSDVQSTLIKVFPEPFHIHHAFLAYHESQRDSARIRVVVDGLMEYLASKRQLLLGFS